MISRLFLILICFLPLNGCYLLEQTSGQLSLRFNQIDIKEAIQKEKDPEIKALLQEIPSIRSFAEEKILLNKSDNYTGYFQTDQKGITYVVTASPKNQLKPFTWWFPIIGSVPYKGYFDINDAKNLETELKAEGLDTWLFAAPAYSSLGWFKDPVTTPMLRKGLYYLVNTIIHEMVHVTLYVDDQGDFNEQLASFVARKAAAAYLKERPDGDAILKYQIQKEKAQKTINKTIHKYIKKLENLYQNTQNIEIVLKKRELLFEELSVSLLKKFPGSQKKTWIFNNARLLQYRRYQSDNNFFEDLWIKSNQNWNIFWNLLNQNVIDKNWD